MLVRKQMVRLLISLNISMLALFSGGAAPHSLAAVTMDAVVGPPCGEAQFDAALMTVQASPTGGAITFQCGEPATIQFTSIKLIGGNVSIDGGAPSAITLSGGGASGLFLVDNGNLTARNLTLAHAAATQQGAIAVGPAGQLTLENCLLTDNLAIGRSGGAIDDAGKMKVTHCAFANNHADVNGGAINIEPNATALISATMFLSNTAAISGGGLYNLSDIDLVYAGFSNNTAQSGDGGGVWTGKRLSIDYCLFYSNTATTGWGGGVYNQGTVNLEESIIQANSAGQGGGGIQTYLGTTQLYQATVIDNEATPSTGVGGGLLNSQGQLIVDSSTISGNRAAGGGGVSNYGGTVSLSAVTLSGNIATVTGGGVKNESGNAYLANATLNGNSALGGGGFYNYNATAYLTNVTLSGNSASNPGGGISNSSYGAPHLYLFNTIVTGSPAGNNCHFGSNPDTSLFNLSSDNSCNFGAGRDNVDLRLAPLGNYGGPTQVLLPLPGSAAIDGGGNLYCPPTDQRDKPRPVNGTCDAGAVERQPVEMDIFINIPLVLR